MSFERLLKSADDLVGALDLRDEVGPDGKPLPYPDDIAELDAARYIVKSLRELRHGIALGGNIDGPTVSAIASRMAAHLGVTGPALAVIEDALVTEATVFSAEFVAKTEELGKHAHFHEDYGVMDARKFPAEENHNPPASERVHRAAFEGMRKRQREKNK